MDARTREITAREEVMRLKVPVHPESSGSFSLFSLPALQFQ